MKKYLLLFNCLIISLIVLSGCESFGGSKSTDLESTAHETVNNLDGVTMDVKKETVSSTGLTVIFENNSDKLCIYGDYFLLEKEIAGKWYEVPVILDDDYGFNDIGYEVDSAEVGEWAVDWEWLYGDLDTGKYRIVKDILDFRKAGDYDKYHLAAEFLIDE